MLSRLCTDVYSRYWTFNVFSFSGVLAGVLWGSNVLQ